MKTIISLFLIVAANSACKAKQTDSGLRESIGAAPAGDLSQVLGAIAQNSSELGESLVRMEDLVVGEPTQDGPQQSFALAGDADVRKEILELSEKAAKAATKADELTPGQRAAAESLADNLDLLLQLMSAGTLTPEEEKAVDATLAAVRVKVAEKPKPKGPPIYKDIDLMKSGTYLHADGSFITLGNMGRVYQVREKGGTTFEVENEESGTGFLMFTIGNTIWWFAADPTGTQLDRYQSTTGKFADATRKIDFKPWTQPVAVQPKPAPRPVYHCSAAQTLSIRYIDGQRANVAGSIYEFMLAPSSSGNPLFSPGRSYTVRGYIQGDTLYWCD